MATPKAAAIEQTANVLEMMTKGVMAGKQAKAATLTPTAMEAREPTPIPARAEAPFPYDAPLEVLTAAIREIRRQVVFIADALDAVELAANGKTPLDALDPGLVANLTRVAEAEADKAHRARKAKAEPEPEAEPEPVPDVVADTEAFEARWAAQQEAAQASAFAPEPEPVWVCPLHKESIAATTRKGRESRKCPKCESWQPA